MPAITSSDLEIIARGPGGGKGGQEPPSDYGEDGGNAGGSRRKPPQKRFSVAITLAMMSILMFFLIPSAALIVLERTSVVWVPLRLPKILLLNTALLLSSSLTLELARRQLSARDFSGFRKFWRATTVLGILFLFGQFVAWLQLVKAGIHVATTQAGSFFYVLTGAHGVHLLGGIAGLCFVLMRNFERGKISRLTAVAVTSCYWHFMDGLWVFLLALLYLAR